MKYVNFKTLTIKNFLSVGEKPVVINFSPGLNIITGINKDKEDRRNGVGKSTIADALYFSIFGETLREINAKYIRNNLSEGKVKVSLDFEITSQNNTSQINIIRELNPAKVYLTIDNKDMTRDSIANTNAFIESILSTNSDIFKNCVTLTINNTIPFMGKKKGDKRKFIESIFNLEVFSRMSEKLKSDINEVKNSYNTEFTCLQTNESTYTSLVNQSNSFEEDRKNRLEKYEKRKRDNLAELATLQDYFNTYVEIKVEPLQEKYKTLNENIKKADVKLNNFHSEISKVKTQIVHLSEKHNKIGTDEDKCPICMRTIEALDLDHIKSEKDKVKAEILNKDEERKNMVKELDQFVKLKGYLETQESDVVKKIKQAGLTEQTYKNNLRRKEQVEGWLSTLDEDIKNVTNQTNSFNNVLVETKNKIDASKDKIEKVKALSKVLENVKFVVSEEGVKSYIIKKILQLFNNKIQFYLSKLDSNSVLTFDEYFDEIIINDKGIECSYNNFSGAEKKTIDLACLFAFMDIRRLQGDVAYNVCLFDELLDSSFDEKGVELVLDVLKERSDMYGECCYIISHRKESIKAATGEIIYLEKYNGLTQRMEFNGL